MLLPRGMTTSVGKCNGMSVLLLVAARFSLDLEEYQTSASQEGHCLEPARDRLLIVLNVNYLRDFVEGYSTLSQPLHQLLTDYNKTRRVVWTPESTAAFTYLILT